MKVINVPHPFWKLQFKSFLERLRLKYKIEQHQKTCIVDVRDYCKNTQSVIVEFTTEAVLLKFINEVQRCHFLNHTLEFQVCTESKQDVSDIFPKLSLYKESTILDDTKISNNKSYEKTIQMDISEEEIQIPNQSISCGPCLLVEELPDDFVEAHFRNFLNKFAWNSFILSKPTEAVVNITEVDDFDLTCKVEFISQDVAKRYFNLQPMHYEDKDVIFKRIPANEETICNTPVSYGPCLLVEELPDDFVEAHFRNFLNKFAWNSFILSKPSEAVVNITEVDKIALTCKVEFISQDVAKIYFNLQPMHYEDKDVIFKRIPANEETKCDTPVSYGPCLLVEELPDDFVDAHFRNYLNKFAWKSLFLSKPTEAVVNITEVDKIAHTCKVEFLSGDVAKNIFKLQYMEYEDKVLKFMRVPENLKQVHGPSNPFDMSPSFELMSDFSSPASDDLDLGPCGVTVPYCNADKNNNAKVNLDAPDGTKEFYSCLLQLRRAFSGKNHSSAYARLLGDLAQKNVETSIPELVKKRKALLDGYNRAKRLQMGTFVVKGEDMLPFCKVVFGGEPIESLEKTKFCDLANPDEVAEKSAVFTKGAVFTNTATKCILSLIESNLDAFNNASGRTRFWKDISKALVDKGHWYDSAQCENHFLGLKKKFKDIEVMRSKTGVAVDDYDSKWPYFSQMQNIMRGNVTVYPKGTVACGSTFQVSIDAEYSLDRTAEKPFKQVKSSKDERTEALKDLVKALAEKNKILKRKS
ncbi:Ribonuclease J [Frankliniella fusca]|uniref:Ribonuclease J n=1 Tax=Frankliniella fusca TaxID=407009 RepID=A0AAE1LTI6_9NEOP|nr:Ribonuclease J [Frankliniella fusca]